MIAVKVNNIKGNLRKLKISALLYRVGRKSLEELKNVLSAKNTKHKLK